MQTLIRTSTLGLLAVFLAAGCGNKGDAKKADAGVATDKKKPDDKTTKKLNGAIPAPEDVAAPPADAQKTPAGLPYRVLSKGTGTKKPGRNDTVKVHYTGWKTSGKMYRDTTRGQPVTMPLPRLGPGWVETLTTMVIGEKRRIWLTPELARSKRRPSRARDTIVYDVELLEIIAAPPVPKNLTAPADATVTKSKLAYKELKPATGKDKPNAWDRVTVHYSVWDPEGVMIDSTSARKRPSTLVPTQRGDGWAEAIQMLAAGQKARFWIPAELNPPVGGKPTATVVDLEVVSIKAMPKPPETPKDVAKPPRKAKKTKKGVHYLKLERGKGKKNPRAWDGVTVHYTGWTTDGKMFDSSVSRGRPATFRLSNVVEGWSDALQLMVVGDKWRIWIPEELAYKGARGKPKGMLVFEVELQKIAERPKPPEPPKAPKDVAKPPSSAKKTAKGVSYKVLKKGKGGDKPKATDSVTVHYTGWTTDGKMFDSSVTRGRPATFGLSHVIAGWTDGLQVMSVGDKVRFWIPEALAYKGVPGKPKGMLVFDVELINIKKK